MTEDWLKALLGKPDEKWKLAKLKEEHPYVADLIRLLLPYRNNGMRRYMILHTLEKERKNAGLPIPPRAVQRSLLRVIAEQPVESADGISISRVGHVGDVVGAHDVGGETADASENAGVFADATGVLAHGDITRIVVPV